MILEKRVRAENVLAFCLCAAGKDREGEFQIMEKPMTTKELFCKILDILKDKGRLPEILDYSLADGNPVPITTYEFELRSNLNYGGNEGIYLDLWIEYFNKREKCQHGLGTFKTLYEDNKAMYRMAELLADFVMEERAYVNGNLDDFTWEGADVYVLDDEGKRLPWGYSCGSMERALKRKDQMLEKYHQVVVRDNATRKEERFQNQRKR